MQRKLIPGHFTRIDGSQHIGISEEEARRLVANHCRNVDEQIAAMKGNPFGQVKGEGCLVRYEVHQAPVVTVPDGGPGLRNGCTMEDQAQFMLDLIAEHAPTTYAFAWDRWHNPDASKDVTLALMMENLDNCAGTDITFTVRQHEVGGELPQILGFWPIEETQSE